MIFMYKSQVKNLQIEDKIILQLEDKIIFQKQKLILDSGGKQLNNYI